MERKIFQNVPGHPEHRRRSIRLKNYDYSLAGAYFITICTHDRECLFGAIENGEMRKNNLGAVVERVWLETPVLRPQTDLDAYVVMPNHFHAILVMDDSRRGVWQYAPTNAARKFRSPSQTIGAVIRGFKSAVTVRINEIRKTPGLPVWQRNYYEHVIRSEKSLAKIREYIAANPLQWEFDLENPQAQFDSIKRNEILKRQKDFQEKLKTAES